MRVASIIIKNLVKTFDKKTVKAVDNLSITIDEGSLVTFLGPSGCGKTTTLRCVAGLEAQDSGEIYFGEKLMSSPEHKIDVPPEKRGIGMVFQSYAIWPHMSVFENVAYPLRRKKLDKNEIRKKVMEALDTVGLGGLENRYPTKMSGGQQQRVAFARAIVAKPEALLFDEPLSNLDAKLRERMRFEIVELQKSTNITTLYVTHDQAEAMVISDRIAIMNLGVIEQIGTSREIYEHPRNQFVAGFIGLTNFIRAKIVSKGHDTNEWLVHSPELGLQILGISGSALRDGQDVVISIRPAHIQILRDRPADLHNVVEGRIERMTYTGECSDLLILLGSSSLRVQGASHVAFEKGDHIFLFLPPQLCTLLTD
jgi:iron(III) transport system ATP-binding protein